MLAAFDFGLGISEDAMRPDKIRTPPAKYWQTLLIVSHFGERTAERRRA
jgi:hypothetical protein